MQSKAHYNTSGMDRNITPVLHVYLGTAQSVICTTFLHLYSSLSLPLSLCPPFSPPPPTPYFLSLPSTFFLSLPPPLHSPFSPSPLHLIFSPSPLTFFLSLPPPLTFSFLSLPFCFVLSLSISHIRLFTRLVLEAPRITPSALEIIQSYCHDEVHMHTCVVNSEVVVTSYPGFPKLLIPSIFSPQYVISYSGKAWPGYEASSIV